MEDGKRKNNKIVRGYVASGGAAKGAWGAGVSHYLVNDLKRKYDYLSGTSTGSLMMNMVALGDTLKLKEAYTSVTNDDIYKVAPYRIVKKKNGSLTTKMNYLKIGWNLLFRRQLTFGDSTKLREQVIPRFFTRDDFNKIKENGIEMLACVTNLTLGGTEYKSSMEYEYEDFLDWVFASTCAAPIMSMIHKDKCDYADGGYIEHLPLQVLIDKGCTEIDIIDHSSPELNIEIVRNPLALINRIMVITMHEVSQYDKLFAKISAREHDVRLNFYRMDRKLTDNSFVFDKELMTEWWNEGYEKAKSQSSKSSFILHKDKRKGVSKIED